jgi:hypothetical protein
MRGFGVAKAASRCRPWLLKRRRLQRKSARRANAQDEDRRLPGRCLAQMPSGVSTAAGHAVRRIDRNRAEKCIHSPAYCHRDQRVDWRASKRE